MAKFVILNTGYPMQVHRVGCQDLSKRDLRGMPQDWIAEGETVDAALAPELVELNSQFDNEYTRDELFRVLPCCK